jgi:LEA14-like dessication related protein
VKEVLEVKVTEFSDQGVKADVYLSITNPNGYKVSMTESHIVLVFEGKTLGEVVLEEPLVIPKRSMTTHVMKVNSAYGDLSSLMGNVLSMMFQSEFELEGRGYVKGKALFLARKVPVEFKQKLSRKDLGF